MLTSSKTSHAPGMFARFATLSIAAFGALGLARAETPALRVGESSQIPELTLVWVGRGEAYAWRGGEWLRNVSQDYEFSVVQRRFKDRWESVKTQSRRHPAYDGSAGDRDQVHHFRVSLEPATGAGEVRFALKSTFGDGSGFTDTAFRKGLMDFEARGVSMFAPFNRYRINQQYLYEAGELRETVELFKRSKDGETPFARIEENAKMMASTRFDSPPTLR
jgi:hypothetical protein